MQQLSIPFTSRSVPGKINVTIQPNTDTHHGCGLDIIFPSSSTSDFQGFPVMKATIDYQGPSSPFGSYAQLFGWIQFVKAIPSDASSKETGEWEMDIFPFAKDLGLPFACWGHCPTMLDAPARLPRDDGTVDELVWRAQTFLCVLEDAGISKSVKVLKGASFEWGFDTKNVRGDGGLGRSVEVTDAEILDLEKEWAARLDLLRKEYPAWTFGDDAMS